MLVENLPPSQRSCEENTVNTQGLSGSMGIDRRVAMLRIHPTQWFVWFLALTLGFWAVLAQGEELRYRYISLDQVELPPGFISFGTLAIHNSGRLYGVAYDDSFMPHVAVYADGAVT